MVRPTGTTEPALYYTRFVICNQEEALTAAGATPARPHRTNSGSMAIRPARSPRTARSYGHSAMLLADDVIALARRALLCEQTRAPRCGGCREWHRGGSPS